MPAGFNTKVRIWRINYDPDDVVGEVRARLESNPEDQLLLQQGLETEKTFNALVIPGTLEIKERDELQIIEPDHHPYYADRFRITSVQYSSMDIHNPNSYIRLSLVRSEVSHTVQ
jgi:hypothetical protein